MKRGRVLITRPIEDCGVIQDALIAKNYDVICKPFLKVILHDIELPNLQQYAGLIFTSQNGVRAFCKNSNFRDIAVFTVGQNTADEAVKQGFKTIHNADGTVEDLGALIAVQKADKPYLYLRAREVSKDLAALCGNVQIEENIIYHTEKIDEIDNDIEWYELSHVLFFSRRTAQAFVAAVRAHPRAGEIEMGLKRTKALCLGHAMVESVSVLPWQEIIIANRPNREGMLALFYE